MFFCLQFLVVSFFRVPCYIVSTRPKKWSSGFFGSRNKYFAVHESIVALSKVPWNKMRCFPNSFWQVLGTWVLWKFGNFNDLWRYLPNCHFVTSSMRVLGIFWRAQLVGTKNISRWSKSGQRNKALQKVMAFNVRDCAYMFVMYTWKIQCFTTSFSSS